MSHKLLVKKLNSTSKIPVRGSQFAAGLDLFANTANTISAGDQKIISTGISISLPEGVYGRVAPRSGITIKYRVDVKAGVIDRDYRGEVKVVMYNYSDVDFIINAGDKIAQLILEKYEADVVIIEGELSSTSRGEGGFGSTGK